MEIVESSASELVWPRIFTCPRCSSVLRVSIEDIRRNGDYLGEFTSWWIICPACQSAPDVPRDWWPEVARMNQLMGT